MAVMNGLNGLKAQTNIGIELKIQNNLGRDTKIDDISFTFTEWLFPEWKIWLGMSNNDLFWAPAHQS